MNAQLHQSICCEPLEARRLFSTYLVTSLGDGAGTTTPTGVGKFNATTLRAAIAAANARAGSDVIKFAANVRGTIALATALPRINDTLIIAGPGAGQLTIQRKADAPAFSVFFISNTQATLGGLAITGGTGTPGELADPPDLGDGGGIHNSGALVVSNCNVVKNRGTAGSGIWNSGKLTVINSNISNNEGTLGPGTGIYNAGTAILANTTISGNSVRTELSGGGIYNEADARLTATNCTIANNSANYRGAGGIENRGIAALNNCTIAGNSNSWGDAGAIYNDQFAKLSIVNCTIVGNSASASGVGGIFHVGGGIAISNSIVAGNWTYTRYDDSMADIQGYAVIDASSTGNVIGQGGSSGMVNGVNGNKVGVDPVDLHLGGLVNNGGPTATMALLPGSVAINAGSNARAKSVGLYSDQRGRARVSSGGRVDAGAFETSAASGASIAGTVFDDRNHDTNRQSTEPLLAGWQVYIDQNRNGLWDAGEMFTMTSSTGSYRLQGLAAGTSRVRLVRFDGWTQSRPAAGYWDIVLATNQQVSGKVFGAYYV